MKKINIEFIFPQVVGFQHNFLSEKENRNIIANSYRIKESSSLKNNSWLSGEKSPSNTFSSYNLVNDKNFSFMLDKVDECVKYFSEVNNDFKSYFCNEAWLNFYESDNYQEPHTHPYRSYSVVYFPQAPPGSGKICFINPNVGELGGQSHLFPTSNTWVYEPKDRMLLIFRSNLRHYVLHGNNNRDRISIAFNYMETLESYSSSIVSTRSDYNEN